jgi:leader peptidase (prepilin peptidase)/N-methyltransferase
MAIGRQLHSAHDPRLSGAHEALDWVPIVGAVRRRRWLALAVEVLSGYMAFALVNRYGLGARSLVLFAGSLVLIHTGAIDFKTRLIDTLILVVATLVALILAPVNGIGWLSSGLGLMTAGFLFFFLFILATALFPRVAAPFGLGDVYLAAFIGALVGFAALPAALFLGIVLAGIVAFSLIVLRAMGRKVPAYIAYGTYLCLGALLFLAAGAYP